MQESIATTHLHLSGTRCPEALPYYLALTFGLHRETIGDEHSEGKQDTSSDIDIEKRNDDSVPIVLLVDIMSHLAVTSIGGMKSGV